MNAAREPNPFTTPITPITPGRRRRVTRASPPRRTKSDVRTSPCNSPRRRSRSNDDKRPSVKLQALNDTTAGVVKVAKRTTMGSPNSQKILLRKTLQGERSGIRWTIVFDTPFSHGKERMNIVAGVETLDDDRATEIIISGRALHGPVDLTNRLQEDIKKPALPERITEPNATTKRRSSGEKASTIKEDAGEIAVRRRESGEKSGVDYRSEKTATRRMACEKTDSNQIHHNEGTAPQRISGDRSQSNNTIVEGATPRRISGDKSQSNNTIVEGATPRRVSGDKSQSNNTIVEEATPRRISGDKSQSNYTIVEGATQRRVSGDKSQSNNTIVEGATPRRISGDKSQSNNTNVEGATQRRVSGDKSNVAAPRRTSGNKSRENAATPRRVSGEKIDSNTIKSDVAAPRRVSGERGDQNAKHDESTPRRVSGEENNNQNMKLPKKGSHDLANRYFTRSNYSDSERSADDDSSIGEAQPSNAVLGNNDDFSIDPLANFLPRAIDESIHRSTLALNQLSFAESQISEDSGLEVRPARRGRRHNAKRPPTNSRVQKGKAVHISKGSHIAKGAASSLSPRDYSASRKSLSSASDTSSYDTNGVSATFMQFTLAEKGFVQTLSKDHDIASESTMQLAKAVAESSVSHLPMYQQNEDAVASSESLELGAEQFDGDDIDQNRHSRQENGIKLRFNQIGRKLRDVQRSISGDGLEIMKSETKKKRNFLKAAHASFMRSSTSDDEIFGLRDDLSSENNGNDAMQED